MSDEREADDEKFAIEVAAVAAAFCNAAQIGDLVAAESILKALKVQHYSHFGRAPETALAAFSLAKIAATGADVLKRLQALALLGKLDFGTKRQIGDIRLAGKRAMAVEPPRLVIENRPAYDADARADIAHLVYYYADAPWVIEWTAKALVDETKGAKPRDMASSRDMLARLLLERADSVAAAFIALTNAVPGSLHERPGTKGVEISRSKQTARLFEKLQPELRLSTIETGDDLPAITNQLIKALVTRFPAPKGDSNEAIYATGEVVAGALGLIQTLVRTRFSISIEPESYAMVRPLQVWAGGSWPSGDEMVEARNGLSRSVREAISLLAQMQKPNRDMLAALILLVGDRDTALRSLAPIARLPGLSPEVQMWLTSGGTATAPRHSEGSAEGAWREADALLAQTSARAVRLRSVIDKEGAALVRAVRATAEGAPLAGAATLLVNLGRSVAQNLVLTMGKRGLELFGTPGEIIEFAPGRHEASDGKAIDTATVEIMEPGALRRGPTGVEDVIRKAIVRSK